MVTTPNLGLALQATGDNPNTWGTVLDNSVFTPIDTYLGGTFSVSVAGSSNVQPSTANALNLHHVLTGVLTGNISYIFPAVGFFKIIDNQTTGAFTITVITVAGGSTGVVCPQGQKSKVYSDGTNVSFEDTRGVILTGNNAFTGNNTYAGTTGLNGTTTMGAALNETFATIASAGTTNIGAAAANYLQVTGTTGITAFDTVQAGVQRELVFAGILTLTNSANLILLGGGNYTTAAGDVLRFRSEGSGNWRQVTRSPASGAPILKQQVFTGNGTFTAPANTNTNTVYKITVVGGGGGGGAASNLSGAGGGGAGATAVFWGSGIASGATCAVTVGGGGGGGAANSSNNGTSGTNSTVVFSGTTITGAGGIGGATGNINGAAGAGGAGGSATNGTINIGGGAGQTGVINGASSGQGGMGGNSSMGGAGLGTVYSVGNSTGGSAVAPGGGGGGGGGTGAGGSGATGIVIFEWVQ